ncbi:hypothetical protein ELG67_09750 [Rhizobium leguminosarum]|uniref:nSTAND3 domain-containing NTPase n=1 Tax=Rhizobium leguminosarum TaxID=384 RepID=UPI001037878B|nr:restriction endonuclease [Rhizobium leguminosarum]TBG89352.1 hypothetical protein ELG67_09750 [Rhizobium leguminosarum]
MTAYDFQRLSPYDFEELVRDLLQAEWGVLLECFTAGKDGGIDLRCLRGPNDVVIVQCKHTEGTTYSHLLRSLRTIELPKVQALKPSRYLVVTSTGLTPSNKDGIAALFSPYIHNVTDVVGRDDVENLLRRHPTVELANFKLWLTSTAVMTRVLHNAEHCQTDFEVDRVLRKLPVFVQSDGFPRAQKILSETHTVVISGAPGIGKTTLADMLLYAHLDQGFEPVVVQGGIVEAKRLFDKSKRQIFYFDDFLGSTFFRGHDELIDRNQDVSLIAFIEAIGRSPNSRFVLTTREHVLRSALKMSERLANSQILDHRCVLELGDYTYSQKARILYNHLHFSDLPQDYRDEVLAGEFYLQIVKHRNFIPRIIEWLSGYVRVKEVPPQLYRTHVAQLLESPERIWSHAFNHQISSAARNLLLSMAASKYGFELADLELMWAALHQHCSRKYNFSTTPHDFRRALDELEGSFINIKNQRITFANPSIHDFVDNLIRGSEEHINDQLDSAIRFVQPQHLFDLANERSSPALAATMADYSPRLFTCLQRVLYGPHLRWTKKSDGGSVGTFLDTYPESRLQFLVEWSERGKSRALLEVLRKASDFFLALWADTGRLDITPAIRAIEAIDGAPWVQDNGGRELQSALLEVVLDEMRFARVYEWDSILEYHQKTKTWDDKYELALQTRLARYKEDGINDEARECSSISELEELRDGLISIQKDRGLSLADAISSVESRLEEYEGPERPSSTYEDHSFPETYRPPDFPNDEEIRNLFRTLI